VTDERAWSPQSRSTRLLIAVAVILALGQVVYATARALHSDSDLVGFHDTAVHLWRTGELTQVLGWKFYLPGFAVLALPFIVWPLWLVTPVWAILNLAALWWTVRESSRLARFADPAAAGDAQREATFHLRWTLPIVAVFVYAADSISLGQFNIFVLALCVAAYSRSRHKDREFGAGALAGLAAVIKLFPLALAVFWIVRGQWKAAVTAIVSFILIAGGLSLAVFGWAGSVRHHRAWLEQVRGEPYTTPVDGDRANDIAHLMFCREPHQWMRHNNQSLAAVVRRLTTNLEPARGYKERRVNVVSLSPASSYVLYRIAAAAMLVSLLAATWRTRHVPDVPGMFAAWMAAVMAFVPVYWTHYFILVLPAVALLCRGFKKQALPTLLLAAWIAGELLLGSRTLRLVGVQCWLTLIVVFWAMYGDAGFYRSRTQMRI
jgi:hypothetical protein